MSTALYAIPLESEALRVDFPVLQRTLPRSGADPVPLVYLDNASTSQVPRQVLRVMSYVYQQTCANVHRGIHRLAEETTDLYEGARRKVQAFVNAQRPEEVIFTSGTTHAINLVARSWGDLHVHRGDEIIVSEMEHHSNLVPWQQLAGRTGAILRYIPLTADSRLELEALDTLLNPRTRLVAVTAMSNVLGTLNPVGAIARRAHQVGAVVLVDGAQSVPHRMTNVAEMDVDFLAFSAHKMFGPSGVGVLYGRRSLLEEMPPFLGGGSMIGRVGWDGFDPADLPGKFEAGTPPIVAAIGLGAAVDYLGRIGMRAVAAQEQFLGRYAHEILEHVEGLRIFGPQPSLKGPIVSFTLDGVHPHDVAQGLDRLGVAVRAGHHCAMPLHDRLGVRATVRASFCLYNTPAEIDRLAEALEELRRTVRRPR